MASLVQFLVAGVNGAANGTATFVLRGTASSAASVLYSDFEGLSQPGTNIITLDANGAAEVYCDAYCDVTIRDSGNTLIRTVTIGHSAPLVEVQSPSFTGTDYDGSPANTAGEPITLKALLDKWITSAGATDWQVLFGGVATNLQTALAGLAGMFINVKDPTYGAVGDGVTNDTTAILAAISAAQTAGGGIVFFPPGTYQVTQLNPSVVDIVLMGCGDEASIIRSNSAVTNVLQFSDNTAASSKRITGLGFVVTAAHESIIDIEENQQLTINHCKFSGANVTDAIVRRLDADGESNVTINDCTFVDIEGDAALQNLADDGESFISVSSSLFVLSSSFTGDCIDGPDFTIAQSKFDASAITSGEYYHIDPESFETAGRKIGSVTGCTFLDGGSSGHVFKLDSCAGSCRFLESGNSFSGYDPNTNPVYVFSVTTGYGGDSQVVLGSRAGKQRTLTNDDSSSVSLSTGRLAQAAATVIIHENASDLTVFPGNMPTGMDVVIVVENESGSARDITFQDGIGGHSVTVSSVPDGERAFAVVRGMAASTDDGVYKLFIATGQRT